MSNHAFTFWGICCDPRLFKPFGGHLVRELDAHAEWMKTGNPSRPFVLAFQSRCSHRSRSYSALNYYDALSRGRRHFQWRKELSDSMFRAEIAGYAVLVHPVSREATGEMRWTAVVEDGGWQLATALIWDNATPEQVAMELDAAYEASRIGMF